MSAPKTLLATALIILELALVLAAGEPLLNFTPPTEDNATTVNRNWTEANISIDEPNLDEFILNWNVTNYSIYDDSLVLALSFNNNSAIGDNATYCVDGSRYSNNATIDYWFVNTTADVSDTNSTQIVDDDSLGWTNDFHNGWTVNITSIGGGTIRMVLDYVRVNDSYRVLYLNESVPGLAQGANYTLSYDYDGPKYVPGVFGQGISLDGNDDQVWVADRDTIDFGPGVDFTAMGWFKTTDYVYLGNIFGKGRDAWYSNYWQIRMRGTDKISFENNASAGSSNVLLAYGNWYDNNWHHVAVTVDRDNETKIYMEGTLRNTTSSSVWGTFINADGFTVGYDTYAMHVNMSADEVRMYNRSLSTQEIWLHYKTEFQRYNSTQYRLYTNLTDLKDGTYTYYGWTNNTLGNSSYTANYTAASPRYLYINLNTPTLVLTLSDPTPVGPGNVTFTLDFSEPMNQTVAPTVKIKNSSEYTITAIGWSNSTRWTGWYNFTSSDGDGNYIINVSGAKDMYETVMVDDLSNTFFLDTTPPILAIISPPASANLSSRTITINLTITEGNLNYTNISIINLTGSVVNSTTNTSNGTIIAILSVPADGIYNITATSYDTAGNSNSTSIVNVTSDTTAPTLSCSLNTTSVQIGENISISCNASDLIDSNVTVVCDQANTSIAGVGRVNCTATDDAGNTGATKLAYLVRGENLLVIESNNTNITVNSNQTEIVLYEDSNSSIITIPDTVTNATLDLSYLYEEDNDSVSVALNNSINVSANTSVGVVGVQIPPNITINASTNWTGVVQLPKIASGSTVTVTPDSGKNATVSVVVEVGAINITLNFTRAVRLLIPGESGKYAGFYDNNAFTKITITCANDSQEAGDALADGGGCKIDSSGNLIIWTKHFTSFVTYNQSDLPSTPKKPGGGGGGAGGALPGTSKAIYKDDDFSLEIYLNREIIRPSLNVTYLNIPIPEKSGERYSSFEITPSNFDLNDTVNFTVDFRVSLFWLQYNKIESVYLEVYNGSEWIDFRAERSGLRGNYANYRAYTTPFLKALIIGRSSKCTEAEKKCDGNSLLECSKDSWKIIENCTYGCDIIKLSCNLPPPVLGPCNEGEKICIGNDIDVCVNSTWVLLEKCPFQCDNVTYTCSIDRGITAIVPFSREPNYLILILIAAGVIIMAIYLEKRRKASRKPHDFFVPGIDDVKKY